MMRRGWGGIDDFRRMDKVDMIQLDFTNDILSTRGHVIGEGRTLELMDQGRDLDW